MVLKSNKALFDKIKAEKKANLSEAQYQRWLQYNSRDEYTQEFYDDLSKVERSEINNESDKKLYEQLQERKRAILKQFRDDKTHEIEKLIPGVAQAELDKIDVDLYKIRKRNGKKKTTGLKFNDIAKVEQSIFKAGAISKMLDENLSLLEIAKKITGDEDVKVLEENITPGEGEAIQERSITITVTDNIIGLAETNEYEYYLSTNPSAAEGGEWGEEEDYEDDEDY